MGTRDSARQARDRLLRLERQARTQAEAKAVSEGVAETVALARARGAAIAEPTGRRARVCAQPYRRQSGLEWMARKGRISEAAKAAGESYGQNYRRVKLYASIPSTLDLKPGGGFAGGAPLDEVLAHGEGTEAARRRLAALRRRLCNHADLIAACDAVCGEEMTPREAAGGDRDGARLEAVLKVALEILAGA